MSAPTPSGPLSLPIHYLEESIANSSTFQDAVGVSNVTDAKSRIYWFWAPEATLNVAAIRLLDDFDYVRDTFDSVRTTGVLQVLFEFETPSEYTSNDQWALKDFLNKLGGIKKDIKDNAVVYPDVYLNVMEVSPSEIGLLDPNHYQGANGLGGELLVSYRG